MKSGFLFGALIMVMVFYATPVLAYLDPGSGSVFLQVILGGVAGVMLMIKLFWHRILAIFGREPVKEDEANKET